MEKLNVVYVAHGVSDYGGAAKSLLNLISSVREWVQPIVVGCEEGPIMEMLRAQGVMCVVQPFKQLLEYRKNFSYYLHLPSNYLRYRRDEREGVRAVVERLSGVRVDLVHSNSSVFTFGHSLARALGCPHVWHLREFVDLDFSMEVLFGRNRLRRLLNSAAARICISNAVSEHWRLAPKGTYVIGNAVAREADFFRTAEKERYLLFCSAYLTEQKGALDCIRAFAASELWREGYSLRMFGRCHAYYRATLDEAIREAGIEGCVEIRDFCADLREQYRRASAYVMASKNEGLGRVTIEAIVNGCPVIGRATGGTLDIIEDGRTGFLFDTVEECARLMRAVVASDNTELMARAQQHVRERYTEERYGGAIMEVYGSSGLKLGSLKS